MSSVRRIYVEKKPAYAVAAKDLFENIRDYLGIRTVTGVRVLIRYDIENISDKTYEEAKITIFSEVVWHLDVGSSHPGAVFGPKGLAVRQLKRYASWVQNVVRQFGPYLSWAQDI